MSELSLKSIEKARCLIDAAREALQAEDTVVVEQTKIIVAQPRASPSKSKSPYKSPKKLIKRQNGNLGSSQKINTFKRANNSQL